MLIFLSAPIVGLGFTFTVTFVFNGQLPVADELKVYVIVAVGLAITTAPVVVFKPVVGAHV